MLRRRLIIATASRIVAGGSSIAMAMLLANAFEPETFGFFRFFQLTLVMLVAVAAPGISLSASKLFAQYIVREENDEPPIAIFCLVGSGLAAAVAILVPLLPSTILTTEITSSIWLLALGVFFTAATVVPTGGLIGLERFGRLLVIDLIAMVILIAGALYSIYSAEIQIALWSLIFSQGAGLGLAYVGVFQAIPVRKFLRNLSAHRKFTDFKDVAAVAVPNAVIVVAISLQFWGIGRMILYYGDDPKVFALYAIGVQWFSLAAMLPNVVGRVIFPAIVRLNSQLGPEIGNERRRVAAQALAMVFASTVMVAVGSYAVAPYIIKLYGPAYADESHLIWQFAFAAIPYCLSTITGYFFLAKNAETSWMAFVMLKLAVVLMTCWLCIGFGATAGALSLAVGGFVTFGLAIPFAMRKRTI